ncbi:hypothetical protein [Photobacterium sp. OFAV2-7]|uniref:hypothetical protein n=1 Tax=Photobacterium sp. OFAV2-7 TaxID=2917748 RepID=UPI001EF7428E|nr:hypothetical protein [Photobacterium sp. OFAV2-7]MCG7586061.1 hypothetical protein [Photobacterium sp. OFAV2-7]
MMKLKYVPLVVGSLLLAACSEPDKTDEATQPDTEVQVPVTEGDAPEAETAESVETEQEVEPDSEPGKVPLATDIWQSPTELTFEDTTVSLSSDLWLNSMPLIGDDGTKPSNRLHASVKLQTSDMKTLPKGIDIFQVLLESEGKQWLVKDNLEIRAEGELTLEVVLREGPEWAPGSRVDIAVIFLLGGAEHIIVQHDVELGEVF